MLVNVTPFDVNGQKVCNAFDDASRSNLGSWIALELTIPLLAEARGVVITTSGICVCMGGI